MDGWIVIGCVAAYLIAATIIHEVYLADVLGEELSALLLVFLGVFAIHGAQRLPDAIRRWRG